MKPDLLELEITSLISSIQWKLGYGESDIPQAEIDRAEKPLRTALQTGKVRSFLVDYDLDRHEIAAERWSRQDFWEAAHTCPFGWKRNRGQIWLDVHGLASAKIAAPFAEERIWIEQAPDSIKQLLVHNYLLMMLQYWPVAHLGRELRGKRMLRFLEKHNIGDDLGVTGDNQGTIFAQLVNKPTERSKIAQSSRRPKASKRAAAKKGK